MTTPLFATLGSWALLQGPATVQLETTLEPRRPPCVLRAAQTGVAWHPDFALGLLRNGPPCPVPLVKADAAWLELNAPARIGTLELPAGRYSATLLLQNQAARLQFVRLPGTTPTTGQPPAAREAALELEAAEARDHLLVECLRNAKAPPHGTLALRFGAYRMSAAVQFLGTPVVATLPGTRKLAEPWRAVLESADRFEILALDPSVQARQKPGARFHDWPVRKSHVLDARAAQHELLGLVYQGIEQGQEIAKCFDPRHGIRASCQGQSVDLLICYECLQVHVFASDARDPQATVLATGNAVEPRVSALFRRFGLTIATR